MKNDPPEKIYLQWYGDSPPDGLGDVCVSEVTWAKEQVFDGDIVYVREDLSSTSLKPLLINARSMARRLGVGQKWLCAEAKAGRIPCLSGGGTYLFLPSAVENVLIHRANGGLP